MITSPKGQPTLGRESVAAVALTAYSLAVAAGFARVFGGWGFMRDLALIVVAGHASSFLLRRLRLSVWIAVPIVTIGLFWLLIVLHYRETMSWLFPQGITWEAVEVELRLVRDQFPTAVAPVFYGAGWAALAGFAMVIVVVVSDAFAFHAGARGEALVPGGVLFVFIAALGSGELRVTLSVILIAAGVLAVIALRLMHDPNGGTELRPSLSPPSMLIPAAAATAVAVAVLAGFVGPRIPGADAEAIYDPNGGGNGGVTVFDNPLVDIRSRLTSRSDVEVFRVDADLEAYWRITTLPAFDGRTFFNPGTPNGGSDNLGGSVDDNYENRQEYVIAAFDGLIVPAAADPQKAGGTSSGDDLTLSLNRGTSTLTVDTRLKRGDMLTVVSSAPDLTPEVLRSATTDAPPSQVFIELPDNLPTIVSTTAAEVTAGAGSPYDAALALQQYLRGFEYSLQIQIGHGSTAIESFLTEKVGYCEQFSATMAAMARTLGIPSRVAVGYTPGILDADGWLIVRDLNAHAWPELWFDDVGWVAFEPTPGRGSDRTEGYTGLPSMQDTSEPTGQPNADDGSSQAIPITVPPSSTPSTTQPADPSIDPTATTVVGAELPNPSGGAAATPTSTQIGPSNGSGLPWKWLAVAVLVVAMLLLPRLIRQARRRVTRRLAPAARVHAAWGQAVDAATRAGVSARPSMTAHEWAEATGAELPVAARPMGSLASVVSKLDFGRPGTVELSASENFGTLYHDCELWALQVSRVSDESLSTIDRVRLYFTDLG